MYRIALLLLVCAEASHAAGTCQWKQSPIVSPESNLVSPEQIASLPKNLTLQEIVSRLGPAKRDLGSGSFVLEWETTDDRPFRVTGGRPCDKPTYVGIRTETLIEKDKFGRDLTAVEITAITMAEIKDCEDRVPGFKSDASEYIAKLKSEPRYKEIERMPEFARLAGEASDFVARRREGSNIEHQCKLTLASLQKL
jgi:hypothetical protein